MPFRSNAQRKFMFAAEARGELPRGTAKRWAAHTPKGAKLPEHVKKASAGLFKKLPRIDPKRVNALLQKKAFMGDFMEPMYGRAEAVSRETPLTSRPRDPETQLNLANREDLLASKNTAVRRYKAKLIDKLRKRGPFSAAVARSIAKPSPVGKVGAGAGYLAGLFSHAVGNPVPMTAEALATAAGLAGSTSKIRRDWRRLKLSRRFTKMGSLSSFEFGFFDELDKLAGDDDLPSGFERLLIKGLRRVGKNADPVVVGKMHEIMHAVPQERKI